MSTSRGLGESRFKQCARRARSIKRSRSCDRRSDVLGGSSQVAMRARAAGPTTAAAAAVVGADA